VATVPVAGFQNFQVRSLFRFTQHHSKPALTTTIPIDARASAKLFNKSNMLPPEPNLKSIMSVVGMMTFIRACQRVVYKGRMPRVDMELKQS